MGDDVTKAHLLPYALEIEYGKTVELKSASTGWVRRAEFDPIRFVTDP